MISVLILLTCRHDAFILLILKGILITLKIKIVVQAGCHLIDNDT